MKKFVSLIAIVVAFYSYSSKANDNPFEFRGVTLGMTPEDIGKLESIKYKFMPDPSKLYCSDGVFKYSKFNNLIYVTQKDLLLKPAIRGYDEKEVSKVSNKVKLCAGHKLGEYKYKLQGNYELFSSDVDYRFYNQKLYYLTVEYPFPEKNNGKHLKDIFEAMKKRFDESNLATKIKEFKKKSSNTTGRYFVDYVSKNNIRIRIVLSYSQKSYNWKTKYQGLRFYLFDRITYREVRSLGENLLTKDISDFKKNKENKLKEKNQSKNKTKELKNKYKY